MPPLGFKPKVLERAKTVHALNREATVSTYRTIPYLTSKRHHPNICSLVYYVASTTYREDFLLS
jgi:hypothetical protein